MGCQVASLLEWLSATTAVSHDKVTISHEGVAINHDQKWLSATTRTTYPMTFRTPPERLSMFEKSSFMRGKKRSISPFQDQPPKQQKT
jgi:hypothetical protein